MSLPRIAGAFLTTCVLSICAAVPAVAAWEEPRFEITPWYGYRLGGEFDELENDPGFDLQVEDSASRGLILSFNWDENVQFEVMYSVQSSTLEGSDAVFTPAGSDIFDLDIDSWMIGGSYAWGQPVEPLRGFVGFSAGINHFDPQTPDFDGDSQFAFSFYGGGRVRVARHFGLRFQAAWIPTYINSDTEVFCNNLGTCFEIADANFFHQFELLGGLTFKF